MDREQKNQLFESVVCVLHKHTSTLTGDRDAYLFAGSVTSENGQFDVHAVVHGDNHAFIQLLMQTFCSDQAPPSLRQALLVATANLLSEYRDNTAAMLSANLGIWAEEKFGHIECNCEQCKRNGEEVQS